MLKMLSKSKQRWVQQPEIGNLVRNLRCRMQPSQEKFADELARSFATIKRWGNGDAPPSPLAPRPIDPFLNQVGEGGEVLRARYSLRATEGRRPGSW